MGRPGELQDNCAPQHFRMASYYNQLRIHLSLDKNAPDFQRAQKRGPIAAIPIAGGLHNEISQGLSFDQA